MKIVIAGAGEIGSHLAKMLSMEYHEITVISPDEENLDKISSESDIVTVEGNPTSIDTLISAGVKEADLFIAVNPDVLQDVNIVSAALAKNLGQRRLRPVSTTRSTRKTTTGSSSRTSASIPFSIRRK